MHTPEEERTHDQLRQSLGLLLTGEGVDSLTSHQREAVRELASYVSGGLGVRMSVIAEVEAYIDAEIEPEPVLATRTDFRDFALANGYTARRGLMSWGSVSYTESALRTGRMVDDYPSVRYVDRGKQRLDLISVYARLASSRHQASAWIRGTRGLVGFLDHLSAARLSSSVSPTDDEG